MSGPPIPPTDVVFIDSLQLSANIGPDCWGRARAQPVVITVYLHLLNSYLTRVGESDDVRDSVHYGHLSKAITQLLEPESGPFEGVGGLVKAVTEEAFVLAGGAAAEVRVVVEVPKLILLAGGFSVDVTSPAARSATADIPKKVTVKDLVLAVIIGVNAPEREAKQRVITNIIFFEHGGPHPPIDYPHLISVISNHIESSTHLTLEKFVLEIARMACLSSSEKLHAVTVRAQKPSALTFAHSSGVEITRERSCFVLPQ